MSRPRSSVPSQERAVRAPRQAVRGQADVAVLLVRPVPDDARRAAGRRSRPARSARSRPSEIIATRSRRSRSQASCQGLRPWMPASPLELGGGRARELGIADRAGRSVVDAHDAGSSSAAAVERQVGRDAVDAGPGESQQLAVGQREVARHRVVGASPDRLERRVVGRAALPAPSGSAGGTGSPTAGSSARARRRCRTIRSRPSSRVRVGDGHRRQQRAGVRVRGWPYRSSRRRDLDDLAQVHHRDPVADVPHHRQVVGDEHVGEPSSSCRSASRLMIWAWIETSSAETGSSQTTSFGLQRQRPGDADPLALAAGELGREAVVVLGVQPDQLHQLLHPPLAVGAVGDAVDGERVADDRADAAARVQRAVRVLEDHLHLAPQRRAARRGTSWLMSRPSKTTRPDVRSCRPGHAAGQRGLAAAGLADQAEGLAPRSTRRRLHAVHRAQTAGGRAPTRPRCSSTHPGTSASPDVRTTLRAGLRVMTSSLSFGR